MSEVRSEVESTKQKAIEKLQTEMNKNIGNSYIQVIGQFLTEHIQKNPNAAEFILSKDKSIKKSLDVMKTEAIKKAVNGFAMFTPNEGFEVVLKYFDLKAEYIENPEIKISTERTSRFDVKLEDLL